MGLVVCGGVGLVDEVPGGGGNGDENGRCSGETVKAVVEQE